MASEPAPTSPDYQAKQLRMRRHHGGNLDKITPEIVLRIAERVAKGLSRAHAVALDSAWITTDQFDYSLKKDTVLQRMYSRKVAEIIEPMLEGIRGKTRSTLPVGDCWLLERVHGYRADGKGSSTTVNVNVIAGFESTVVERASQMLRARHAPSDIRRTLSGNGNLKRPEKRSIENTKAELSSEAAAATAPVVDIQATVSPIDGQEEHPATEPGPTGPNLAAAVGQGRGKDKQ
jgi:hypothetical protein